MNKPIKINIKGKEYTGFKKCPSWLREAYLRAVKYKCEYCQSKENLEIHRPKRGVEEGLYLVVKKGDPACNWQVLCHRCHEIRNYSRKNDYTYQTKSQVVYK